MGASASTQTTPAGGPPPDALCIEAVFFHALSFLTMRQRIELVRALRANGEGCAEEGKRTLSLSTFFKKGYLDMSGVSGKHLEHFGNAEEPVGPVSILSARSGNMNLASVPLAAGENKARRWPPGN